MRLDGEIKRRTDVVGIVPNGAAITRLVGTTLLEQNGEHEAPQGPVREAVLALVADGLAVEQPRRGVAVAEIEAAKGAYGAPGHPGCDRPA